MKKLTHDQKPSDKKLVKAKAAKKDQPDIIYLGFVWQEKYVPSNSRKMSN
tara:strand:- start:1000 stop:1149 length:150 start_codon:yes stop_codon:yes gene_type:complete